MKSHLGRCHRMRCRTQGQQGLALLTQWMIQMSARQGDPAQRMQARAELRMLRDPIAKLQGTNQ